MHRTLVAELSDPSLLGLRLAPAAPQAAHGEGRDERDDRQAQGGDGRAVAQSTTKAVRALAAANGVALPAYSAGGTRARTRCSFATGLFRW